jgi:hypothetical protein
MFGIFLLTGDLCEWVSSKTVILYTFIILWYLYIVEEAHRYDKGQVPWDGETNPFKHASQWEGAFTKAQEACFDPQFFRILIFNYLF